MNNNFSFSTDDLNVTTFDVYARARQIINSNLDSIINFNDAPFDAIAFTRQLVNFEIKQDFQGSQSAIKYKTEELIKNPRKRNVWWF